jgi:hypothetical protein
MIDPILALAFFAMGAVVGYLLGKHFRGVSKIPFDP